MFPLLSIIVAFLVGLSYFAVVPERHPVDLIGIVVVVVLVGVGAKLAANAAVRRIRRGSAPSGSLALRMALVQRVWSVAAYAVIVYQCHWPQIVRRLGIEHWVLVDDLVILLPFAVLLLLALLATWSAESRLELHEFRLLPYLGFHARQYLLPVAPVLLFLLLADLVDAGASAGIRWVAELRILYGSYPFVQWLALGVLLLALYALIPFLMRFFWNARPLPPGPLRDRLTAFSRRERFRARDILVWPTGGNVMNAAVIGVAGPVRYVLITDGLIESLPPDEIEAVFAHEAGHAKHNHMLLFLLFTLGYALFFFLLASLFEPRLRAWFGDQMVYYLLLGIGGFLAWFGILFGFVSRRFEQQADVFGALATGRRPAPSVPGPREDPDTHPFLRALEALAEQMGDIREVKGWRHFPLGERIRFLREFLTRPEVRRRYRRNMSLLLGLFFTFLLGLGLAAAATIPAQLRAGEVRASMQRSLWLHEVGKDAAAIREALRAEGLARGNGTHLAPEQMPPRERAIWSLYLLKAGGLPPGEQARWLLELSRARRALGERDRARTALEAALAAARKSPGGLADLATFCLKRLGGVLTLRPPEVRPADPRVAASRILDVLPGGGRPRWQRAELLLRLSAAYLAADEPEAARVALTRALDLVGDHPLLLDALSTALRMEDRMRGARLALEDAIGRLRPDHPYAKTLKDRLEHIGESAGGGD